MTRGLFQRRLAYWEEQRIQHEKARVRQEERMRALETVVHAARGLLMYAPSAAALSAAHELHEALLTYDNLTRELPAGDKDNG